MDGGGGGRGLKWRAAKDNGADKMKLKRRYDAGVKD